MAEDIAAIQCGESIIGVDEAGRGCLSGSVYAAAVLATPALIGADIADSKTLSKKRREASTAFIREHAYCAVGNASLEEIARINIRNAAALAMQRAIELLIIKLNISKDKYLTVIVDGNHAPGYTLPCYGCIRTEVSGDARFLSVAAASLIAKTARDHYMTAAAGVFPGYGWERNAGYGTKEHLSALEREGITPLHRTGFAPVKAYL